MRILPVGIVRASDDSCNNAVDLHGFTIPEALARVAAALSDALLTDAVALRLTHGRVAGASESPSTHTYGRWGAGSAPTRRILA